MRKLTSKQKGFIDHYIVEQNAYKAAKLAGYKGSYSTVATMGLDNLQKPAIKAAIAKHWQKRAMDRDEAIGRMSDIARADGRTFITVGEDRRTFIDVARMIREGNSHLIKSYQKTDKGIKVELHDAKDALKTILSHHGAVEPETKVEISVKIVALIRSGRIEPDFVRERWPNLADELFRKAGVEFEPSTNPGNPD